MFYLFYFSFIGLEPVLITLCSGEQDPCIEALNESLKDLEIQKQSQGWLSKKANVILYWMGKMDKWVLGLSNERVKFMLPKQLKLRIRTEKHSGELQIVYEGTKGNKIFLLQVKKVK